MLVPSFSAADVGVGVGACVSVGTNVGVGTYVGTDAGCWYRYFGIDSGIAIFCVGALAVLL